jgi:predicted RNA binding protein YcfA (HicA-like mRNA interferase family)
VLGILSNISGKELCILLEKNGFSKVRQKGSHVIMQRKAEDTTITVPIPIHPEINIGTHRSIIRESKSPRTLFEML